MRRIALAVSMALAASGCLNLDFDPPYVVKGPRILAIVAEPPEIAFGEDMLFETLIVDGEGRDLAAQPGVELRFMVCISAAAIVNASGLGFGSTLEDDCAEGGDDLVRLETGGELPPGAARLPASAFLELIQDLTPPMPDTPPPPNAIDPNVARLVAGIIATVGVPLRMRLEVWRDGELLLTGFKRFAITLRPDPTTNPPPPRFAIGDVWVSAREGGDPHLCVPEEGTPPTVQTGAEVTIRPDEDEEAWIETYPAVALDATIVINEESAYYSWFSTAGSFSTDVTQRPERDVTWTAPEEAGTYPIWLVVRDGHLGSSFCRAEVVVGAP